MTDSTKCNLTIILLKWTDEQYEKAAKALDDINPTWVLKKDEVCK